MTVCLQILSSSILFLTTAAVCNHKDTGQSTEFCTSLLLWILQFKYGLNFWFGFLGAGWKAIK